MRTHFQLELADVQTRLTSLAEAVETAVEQANTAFQQQNVALAEQVIDADWSIDEQARELEELASQVIALQQPVARDLRVLISSLRIVSSLERMGDLARHIATLTRYRFPEAVVPAPLAETFARLGELDLKQARLVVQLLETQNSAYAEQIFAIDDEIDALHRSVFEAFRGADWPADPAHTVDVGLASRYYERFADHAVSVAKTMQYLATGNR